MMFACSCSNDNSIEKRGKIHLKKIFKSTSCCSSDSSINLINENKTNSNYLLIGAPNVGKSTFFNKVTWQHSPVGNADRITVNAKKGSLRIDLKVKLIDLPGVYTLIPSTRDEQVVIESIFNKNYNSALNIVGANSFKRDLTLTIQLLEADILNELIINMVDELKDVNIDAFRISRYLGIPVHLVSSLKNTGVKQSVKSLLFDNKRTNKLFELKYENKYETVINEIIQALPDDIKNVSKRFVAIQLLEGNLWVHNFIDQLGIKQIIDQIFLTNNVNVNDAKISIRNTRNIFINTIYQSCFISKLSIIQNKKKKTKTNKIDKLFLNPYFGITFFIFVIFIIYYITFGNYAGGLINDKWTELLDKIPILINQAMIENTNASEWIRLFVTNGIFGGILTVIGFLPYIIIMFFCISLIEQTGYLARVSLLLDRQLDKFGLSGRSIITLITGIGCNIPSIMMARNCHSQKERTILFLISPFMACSARLIVFIWIANQLNANYSWLIGIGFTIFSGFVTLLMGLLFSKTMFRSSKTFLLTELTKWRKPDLILITKKIIIELIDFLKRVLTLIFLVNLIMFLLMYISPTKGLITNPYEANNGTIDWSNASLLEYISVGFQYIFYPIGLGEDWRFSASLISATPAKEIAASNLALLFTGSDNVDSETSSGFINAIFGVNSIISLPIATLASYLVFFTFYTPCLSTIIVMKKEGGWKKTIIHLISALTISYLLSLFTYAGIGSIEKIILNPELISNFIMIITWVLFSIVILWLLFNIIYKYIFDKKGYPISLKMINIYRYSLLSGFICFILISILAIVFIFV